MFFTCQAKDWLETGKEKIKDGLHDREQKGHRQPRLRYGVYLTRSGRQTKGWVSNTQILGNNVKQPQRREVKGVYSRCFLSKGCQVGREVKFVLYDHNSGIQNGF